MERVRKHTNPTSNDTMQIGNLCEWYDEDEMVEEEEEPSSPEWSEDTDDEEMDDNDVNFFPN